MKSMTNVCRRDLGVVERRPIQSIITIWNLPQMSVYVGQLKIPVGEMVRSKRNCSSDQDHALEVGDICKRLGERGYSQHLSKAVQKVKNISREKLLLERENPRIQQRIDRQHGNHSGTKVIFSTPYSRDFKKHLRHHKKNTLPFWKPIPFYLGS